ncbi:hypothetical protein [Streptomyces sp. NBC_01637]|nr:hypothetical protein OH719_43450 [Streptomyces sp. NBC_01653]WTD86757.1 hypothetical protein OG891_03420 [Streptomyces sp. NBC_01637]
MATFDGVATVTAVDNRTHLYGGPTRGCVVGEGANYAKLDDWR